MDDRGNVWCVAERLEQAYRISGAGNLDAVSTAADTLAIPGLPASLVRRAAQTLSRCGDHAAALKALLSADRLMPGQPRIVSEIAACHAALGEARQSLHWLRKIPTVEPSNLSAMRDWLLQECTDGDPHLVAPVLRCLFEAGLLDQGLAGACARSLASRGCETQAAAALEVGRRPAVGASSTQSDPGIVQGAARESLACLSLAKTSSMALTSALRDAGFENALHLHYFGPMAVGIKTRKHEARGASLEPMLQDAIRLAAHLQDPRHVFRFVTCVRDPIARIISQAFEVAERHASITGIDIVRDAASIVEWYERSFGEELTGVWLDDCYKTPFGFDFRLYPFDIERRSLRYDSDRLRLVILRQEDRTAPKERELGWLVDRAVVPIPSQNRTEQKTFSARYKAIVDSFVAPQRWVDSFYTTEAIQHFYTSDEISAFQARWSARR